MLVADGYATPEARDKAMGRFVALLVIVGMLARSFYTFFCTQRLVDGQIRLIRKSAASRFNDTRLRMVESPSYFWSWRITSFVGILFLSIMLFLVIRALLTGP